MTSHSRNFSDAPRGIPVLTHGSGPNFFARRNFPPSKPKTNKEINKTIVRFLFACVQICSEHILFDMNNAFVLGGISVTF